MKNLAGTYPALQDDCMAEIVIFSSTYPITAG